MAQTRNKQWNFELLTGGISGITIAKKGARLRNKNGKLLEAIKEIETHHNRAICEKAKSYLDFALQVVYFS